MNGSGRRPPGEIDRKDRPPRGLAPGEWWEWIAVFIAIAALWPKILRWDGIIWDLALIGALGLMILVFIRRSRRLREAWRND